MTEKKAITLEQALYLLALGLALALRLIDLGSTPFNEIEASWAWQAYQVSQSEAVQIGSQPAYVLLTSLVFFLFNSSEALARMLPALVGAMVVVLPYALRDKLGRKAALVAAFGLALDPILVGVSRQAGSPMLAVGFGALAVLAWSFKKPVIGGVFAGLFLLSGLPAVPLILAAVVAGSLLALSGYRLVSTSGTQPELKPFLMAGGLTLLVVGTLWMRYPPGLSAMLLALPDYLAGWSAASATVGGSAILQVLAALPIYQPIALLLGLVALLQKRTWQTGFSRALAVLSLVLLSLIVVYPSRLVADLVYLLPLLWLLAGLALAPQLVRIERDDRLVVWVPAVTIVALLSFWWANIVQSTRTYYVNIPEGFKLADFNSLDLATKDYLGRMAIVAVIPFVLVILVGIVLTNWSKQTALQGALLGFGAFAVFYVTMVLFGFSDLRPEQANELWNPPRAAGYADDLREALAELSEPITGNRNDLEVVYQLDLALLHWTLRDMPNARFVPVLAANETPAVIINELQSLEEMSGAGTYRGENIAIQLYRSWGGQVLPADFDRWFVYREAPVEKQWVMLWAREDIFVGFHDMEAETGEPAE